MPICVITAADSPNPGNMVLLLKTCRGEDYKLFWPENAEFIRMAVDSDAIIVPFSAIGIADRCVMGARDR